VYGDEHVLRRVFEELVRNAETPEVPPNET
jgi:hypothetical protein